MLIVIAVALGIVALSCHVRAVGLAETLAQRVAFRADVRTLRGPAMPWQRDAALARLQVEILIALDAIGEASRDTDPDLSSAARKSLERIRR